MAVAGQLTIVLLVALSCLPSDLTVLENFDLYLQESGLADSGPCLSWCVYTWVALVVEAKLLESGHRCSRLQMVETCSQLLKCIANCCHGDTHKQNAHA